MPSEKPAARCRPARRRRLPGLHHGSGRRADRLHPRFLRSLGEAGLITPKRSDGGHRRYSRHQLRTASRARELVDQGTPIEAACRIISLEDRLDEALRVNEELRSHEEQRSYEGRRGSSHGEKI